jgi:DNA-binding transcriptional LysR family regulator
MDFLSAIRVYVRVVECGGLSAAARDLGMGQPAVSERIGQLEKHLGARLLDRTTRSVRATDLGELFYERAKKAIEAADEAEASVTPFDAKLRGTLRIAAPHGIGEILLPSLLAGLQEQHPDLAINLVLNDHFVDPVTEGVDISIRVGAVGDGSFIARPLGKVQRMILAAPTYLAQRGIPTTPQELGAHPFIRVSGLTTNDKLRLISPQGTAIEAQIRTAWRCNHWRPLLTALLADAGIGVLQIPVCKDLIEAGQLIQVLPSYRLPPVEVHAIYPALSKPLAKTRAVLTLLQARMPSLLVLG